MISRLREHLAVLEQQQQQQVASQSDGAAAAGASGVEVVEPITEWYTAKQAVFDLCLNLECEEEEEAATQVRSIHACRSDKCMASNHY
jgi:hypothetical protein